MFEFLSLDLAAVHLIPYVEEYDTIYNNARGIHPAVSLLILSARDSSFLLRRTGAESKAYESLSSLTRSNKRLVLMLARRWCW